MAERELPNNSDRARENVELPESSIKPVAKAKGVKKPSGGRKLRNAIISEDVGDVKDYILMDVLIPSIKKTLLEMVTGGLEMSFGGNVRDTRKKRSGTTRVSYSSYYDDDDRPRRRRASAFDLGDVEFDTRGEAELVLDSMEDILDRYRTVTVFDYYELSGLDPRHTYRNYGWASLRNARVISVRGGYIIDLPKPMPLD